MFPRKTVLGFVVAAGALTLACATTGAVTLDWDTATWTNQNNGFPQPNHYDVDGVPGTDLTVDVNGQVSKLTTINGTKTPAVLSTPLTGGLGEASLHIYANVQTKTDIIVSVTFSPTYVQGVENVSFTLFDIDKTTDSEFINTIYGIALDGTHVPATITGLGSTVSRSGDGLSQVLTGTAPAADNTNEGNATISFGSYVIKGFSFTFDNSQGPGRVQEFAMHDINFTPVPEINPAFSALGSCLMAIGLVFHHRSRVRARRK